MTLIVFPFCVRAAAWLSSRLRPHRPLHHALTPLAQICVLHHLRKLLANFIICERKKNANQARQLVLSSRLRVMEGPRPTSSVARTPACSDRSWREGSRRLQEQREQMARRGKMEEPGLLERLRKGGVSAAGPSDTVQGTGWTFGSFQQHCRSPSGQQRSGTQLLGMVCQRQPVFLTSIAVDLTPSFHTNVEALDRDNYREVLGNASGWPLLCKQEDLGSIPRLQIKIPSMTIRDCNPNAEKRVKGVTAVSWWTV